MSSINFEIGFSTSPPADSPSGLVNRHASSAAPGLSGFESPFPNKTNQADSSSTKSNQAIGGRGSLYIPAIPSFPFPQSLPKAGYGSSKNVNFAKRNQFVRQNRASGITFLPFFKFQLDSGRGRGARAAISNFSIPVFSRLPFSVGQGQSSLVKVSANPTQSRSIPLNPTKNTLQTRHSDL